MTFVELFLSHNECALKATVREPRFVGKLQRRREEHIVSAKKVKLCLVVITIICTYAQHLLSRLKPLLIDKSFCQATYHLSRPCQNHRI